VKEEGEGIRTTIENLLKAHGIDAYYYLTALWTHNDIMSEEEKEGVPALCSYSDKFTAACVC